jgi:RsiW-degrading membrane proteinase PrsW (M82 family)
VFLIASGLNIFLIIYLILAIGPALYLMYYTYQQDPTDKEPVGLLFRLFLCGIGAAFIASVLEQFGMSALGLLSGLDENSASFVVLSDFLVVGLIEEGAKYSLMAWQTWKHPAFDCRYDGIVYAVFVSMGFAAMENLLYGSVYGMGVFFSRAIMAIPAHMAFAVLFGFFYGQAKQYAVQGSSVRSVACIVVGYALSVCLHGLYDSLASIDSAEATLGFFLVVAVIYLIVFGIVRLAAKHDTGFNNSDPYDPYSSASTRW